MTTDFQLEEPRQEAIARLWSEDRETGPAWPAPLYRRAGGESRIMLGLRNFDRHMTSEGHQLQVGLAAAGFRLLGAGYPGDIRDARLALVYRPHTLIVQDRKEWSPDCGACFDKHVGFINVPDLANRTEVFRLTVVKDLLFHRHQLWIGHNDLRPHAVIHYYHPSLVRLLAPWLKNTRLIRTYHSIDPDDVPEFVGGDHRAIGVLSGALNAHVYPLRQRVADAIRAGRMPEVVTLRHPGYGLIGHQTRTYIRDLSRFKVAICTSSIMGFALRKLIEATAAGCRVITDLPAGEVLPAIDGNLIRIPSGSSAGAVRECVEEAARTWDAQVQLGWAEAAIEQYDYVRQYAQLAREIESARLSYVV